MDAILTIIEERRRAYEQNPFIRFLRDDSLSAHERLSYAPYASFFVFSFAEFNRDVLHQGGSSEDRYQQIVDTHASEDAKHFAWYLHDLAVLGYDVDTTFAGVLRFLWSPAGRRIREMSHHVIAVARNASPRLRLVIIEAMEAMGNVWLTATVAAAQGHERRSELLYFGPHHLDRETGHAMGSDPDEVRSVRLTDAERQEAEAIVHGLFDHMEAFNTEMVERTRRAEGHNFLEH